MKLLARLFRRLRGNPRRPLAATINLDDPLVARDPFPHYEALRAEGTVHFLERHQAWLVLGQEEVERVFLQPETFSNAPYGDVDSVLLGADPPAHTRIRKIVTPYFERNLMAHLAEVAAERAAALIGPRIDVVRDYAEPLSESVAARLLGFDDLAVGEIRTAMRQATAFSDILDRIRAVAPRAPMYDRARGDGIDDAEARSLIALFWVASTKTTERVIAQCVLHILRNDGVRRALLEDPTLIGRLVDEVMRLHQPEPILRRVSRAPVELGGKLIPANAMVLLSLAAANRDPAKYDDAAELRLDRTSRRHLTFGHGIHYCIGATLGRSTVVTAMIVLLERAPHFAAAEPLDRISVVGTMMAHYIESLVVDTGARPTASAMSLV
jgi:cytochrome P450